MTTSPRSQELVMEENVHRLEQQQEQMQLKFAEQDKNYQSLLDMYSQRQSQLESIYQAILNLGSKSNDPSPSNPISSPSQPASSIPTSSPSQTVPTTNAISVPSGALDLRFPTDALKLKVGDEVYTMVEDAVNTTQISLSTEINKMFSTANNADTIVTNNNAALSNNLATIQIAMKVFDEISKPQDAADVCPLKSLESSAFHSSVNINWFLNNKKVTHDYGKDQHQISDAQLLPSYDNMNDVITTRTASNLRKGTHKRWAANKRWAVNSNISNECWIKYQEVDLFEFMLRNLSNEETQRLPWPDFEGGICKRMEIMDTELHILFANIMNFMDAMAMGSWLPKQLIKILFSIDTPIDLVPKFFLKFLYVAIVEWLDCKVQPLKPITVTVVDGYTLICASTCTKFTRSMQNQVCPADVYILALGGWYVKYGHEVYIAIADKFDDHMVDDFLLIGTIFIWPPFIDLISLVFLVTTNILAINSSCDFNSKQVLQLIDWHISFEITIWDPGSAKPLWTSYGQALQTRVLKEKAYGYVGKICTCWS